MTEQVTATHCPYCALQCGMNLVIDNGVISVASRAFPTNKGGFCLKGWTAAELLTTGERLTSPILRDSKAGPLRPATWDEALNRIAKEIVLAQHRYGRVAVGMFGGGD